MGYKSLPRGEGFKPKGFPLYSPRKLEQVPFRSVRTRGREGVTSREPRSGSSFMGLRPINEEGRALSRPAFRKTAATYSPNWWVSTIGDGELNFSVRNGKRWFLTAITTALYDLREKTPRVSFDIRYSIVSLHDSRFAFISFRRIFLSGKSFGQLVQVC